MRDKPNEYKGTSSTKNSGGASSTKDGYLVKTNGVGPAVDSLMSVGPTVTTNDTGQYTYSGLQDQLAGMFSGPTPDFTAEANKTAAGIYSPALKDLAAQQKLAQDNAKYNDAQLSAMYSALQGAIGNSSKDISANLNSELSGINSAGAAAQQAIGSNYDKARTSVADLMTKLGIEDAAPDALSRGAEQQSLLQGISGVNTQSAANLARQIGANAQNFNTQQKNIAGFEGAQNRKANQQDLSNKLGNLASLRANVGVQQGQTSANLLQQLQSRYLDSVNAKASALTQAFSSAQQAQQAQQSNELEMLKLMKGQQPTPYQQYQMTPLSEKLAARAGQLFGTSNNSASEALNFIQALSSRGAASPNAFAELAAKEAQNSSNPLIRTLSPNKIRALALDSWDMSRQNPNYMNYLGFANTP